MKAREPALVRFRHHPGRAVVGLIVTISTLTLAAASPLLALLALLPAGYTVWLWRSGTDVDADGIRVRALLAGRRFPWSAVSSLAPAGGQRVVATLSDGSRLPLTAVTPADLPRLVAATGQELASATGPGGSAPG